MQKLCSNAPPKHKERVFAWSLDFVESSKVCGVAYWFSTRKRHSTMWKFSSKPFSHESGLSTFKLLVYSTGSNFSTHPGRLKFPTPGQGRQWNARESPAGRMLKLQIDRHIPVLAWDVIDGENGNLPHSIREWSKAKPSRYWRTFDTLLKFLHCKMNMALLYFSRTKFIVKNTLSGRC